MIGNWPRMYRSAPWRWVPRWRAVRPATYWILGMVLLLGALEWIGWPFLRWPAERALSELLRRDVQVAGEFRIRFIGRLRVRAERVVVGPPPAGGAFADDSPDLLRATGLELAVPYATLFSLSARDESNPAAERRPFIAVLAADHVELVLLRNAAGEANWRFRPAPGDDSRPLVLPEFGRLDLREGDLRIDDVPGQLRAHVTIHSTAARPAHRPDAETFPGVQFNATGSWRGQPVEAHARVGTLPDLVDAQAGRAAMPVEVQARVGATEFSFAGQAKGIPHLVEADGEFHLSGSSLASVGRIFRMTLPTTAPFSMQGHARKDGAAWSASVKALAVGRSRLNGDFSYVPGEPVPHLTGRLGGSLLALEDLAPAVGGATNRSAGGARPGAKGGPQAGSRVLPQREFDTPSLARMNADVTVALDALDLGSAQLERMAPLQGRLVLRERVLSMLELVAGTANGTVRGALSFDARGESPRWRAELNWAGVRLEQFVKTRNPTDRAAASGYVSGILSGRARLIGHGRSTASILGSLNGDVQAVVRGGKISHFLVEALGLDVAQALGVMVRGDTSLEMRCAVTSIHVHNGTAVPEVALIETSDSTLQVSGSVSLAEERLNLLFKAAPKDVSPASLRAPLYVEGNFSDPEVRIDKRSIGLRVVGAAALAAITPLAGLIALIDLGEEDKKACLNAVNGMQRKMPAERRE